MCKRARTRAHVCARMHGARKCQCVCARAHAHACERLVAVKSLEFFVTESEVI